MNEMLDWVLVCLQLRNQILEDTIISAIFLINTVRWYQVDCMEHEAQRRKR
jgi:hypothetical protein